jgi:hypothetical protein
MEGKEISLLYQRDSYLNKDMDILINKDIIEYDLKSANTSLCREYKLLPESVIQSIEDLPRKERVVKIGKMMRKDSKLKEGLKKAFPDMRRRFFEANEIEDHDILTIKKDAIFTLRKCKVTEFGKCKFVPKNQYSSYMYVNKLEIYYKPDIFDPSQSVIHVKGISDAELVKHNNHMLAFLRTLFRHLEESSTSTKYTFIKNFMDNYKTRKLDPDFYREFDQYSIIRSNESDVTYDDATFIPYDNKTDHIEISYNFFNILLPIARKII